MRGITKHFIESGVTANDRINFDIDKGSIHALIGENGTGKSTLMNVLSGLIEPDYGSISVEGRQVQFKSPADALSAGIGMIHQKLPIIPELSVFENIILGTEATLPLPRDTSSLRDRISTLAERAELRIDLDRKCRGLSASELQKVSLLHLLHRDLDLLILDEPTATFTNEETSTLFRLMRRLSSEGIALVFITHKLREVLDISDRISVLRRGKLVHTSKTTDADEPGLAVQMFGDQVRLKTSHSPLSEQQIDNEREIALELRDIVTKNYGSVFLDHVNIELSYGEIMAVTGIREQGLEVIEEVTAGFLPISRGEIYIHGVQQDQLTPKKLRRLGVGYIPTDRLQRGASLNAEVAENLGLLKYRRLGGFGLEKRNRLEQYANGLVDRFGIDIGSIKTLNRLSIGNIQKVILAREIEGTRGVLIFSEPFWGLDMQSRDNLARRLTELKTRGKAILILTSNIDEVLAIADKVAVLYQGKITGIMPRKKLSRELLGQYILGNRRDL